MLAKTFGSALHGVEAFPITLEVSVGRGDDCNYFIVGLPDIAVKESLQRLSIAFRSIRMKMPHGKIVINLAPADVKKTGTGFDLPLALGILGASGQLPDPAQLTDYMIMGELGLDGTILPIKGALPIAIRARKEGFKGIIVPKQNEREAGMVNNLQVYGMSHLQEVVDFFSHKDLNFTPISINTRKIFFEKQEAFEEDFEDVRGQQEAKRSLEIACAGGHNIILIGPPGAGKTMLAKRIPSILPPLDLHEALETTRIYSVSNNLNEKDGLISRRPFRTPHHTISNVALVGGGSTPQPGEISLAHNGVLFLDELPEFQRSVLEVLRQPVEDRKVTISRASMSLSFPSSFMLVASMNPCPCGYHSLEDKKCTCKEAAIARYTSKLSGPLLDRIDMHITVNPVLFYEHYGESKPESSATIRERVVKAREIQIKRNMKLAGVSTNAQLSSKYVHEICQLSTPARNLLHKSMEAMQLSARAYERILKVCRTIADLQGSLNIELGHVAEAIHYRSLDKSNQGVTQRHIKHYQEESNVRKLNIIETLNVAQEQYM